MSNFCSPLIRAEAAALVGGFVELIIQRQPEEEDEDEDEENAKLASTQKSQLNEIFLVFWEEFPFIF